MEVQQSNWSFDLFLFLLQFKSPLFSAVSTCLKNQNSKMRFSPKWILKSLICPSLVYFDHHYFNWIKHPFPILKLQVKSLNPLGQTKCTKKVHVTVTSKHAEMSLLKYFDLKSLTRKNHKNFKNIPKHDLY